MELNCYRLLLVVTLLGIAYGEVVNHFIRHYEPLHYDRDDLMYHHRRLRRSLVGPSHISLQFNAFGRSFDLALKPEKKLLHPNFTLIIDNHVVRDHQLKSFLYTGKDRDDPSITVHGNVFHDVFEGTIYTPDEEYHIEPADRYVNDSSYHSIIYRGSDLDLSTVAGATCGSTHEDIKQELLKTQMIGRARDKGHRLRKRQNRPYRLFPNADANRARCWLNVIGDYKFVQSVGGQGTAMAQLLNIIQQASLIYEGTAFNPAGSPIHFGIQRIMVEPSPPPSSSPFANEFLGVQSFLDLHSRGDFSDFCLSYRFTNRDFDNGVVGLAYIGQALGSNAAGGICDNPITQNGIQKTLNTGIVTNLNFGRQIPPSLSVLTFAHEVGHNFGSNHDPMDSPPGGAYIMSAFATDGSQPNNDNFSPRSITEMTPVVRTRGQDAADGCFLPGDNMCGNRLIDEGEDCECGPDGLMPGTDLCMDDRCCNGTSCRVATNMACSPEQGPCCTADCTFRESTFMCSNDTECALAQMCNGMNATCPAAEPRVPMGNDTLRCNNGENVCVDGVCSGSICLALGPNITACECVGNAMEACEECCMFSNGSCISTFAIANADATLAERLPNGQGRNLQIGFPCKNFTGYCDFFNQCMIVDNDGAINRLFDFFLNSATFQEAIDWIVNMWWVVLIVLVGLLVIMFVIVVIFHIILPRPKYRRKAAAKRRQQRTVPLDKYPGGHGGPQYHRY